MSASPPGRTGHLRRKPERHQPCRPPGRPRDGGRRTRRGGHARELASAPRSPSLVAAGRLTIAAEKIDGSRPNVRVLVLHKLAGPASLLRHLLELGEVDSRGPPLWPVTAMVAEGSSTKARRCGIATSRASRSRRRSGCWRRAAEGLGRPTRRPHPGSWSRSRPLSREGVGHTPCLGRRKGTTSPGTLEMPRGVTEIATMPSAVTAVLRRLRGRTGNTIEWTGLR